MKKLDCPYLEELRTGDRRDPLCDGGTPFFDVKQGTIEFWYQPLWDYRWQPKMSWDKPLINGKRFRMAFTGYNKPELDVSLHGPVNMGWDRKFFDPEPGQWYHIAACWYPWDKAGGKTLMIFFVNGVPGSAHVRSGDYIMSSGGWAPRPDIMLADQLRIGGPGAEALIVELRISDVPRYIKLKEIAYYEFEVAPFTPTRGRLESDEHTLLLLHFDGDLAAQSAKATSVTGTIQEPTPQRSDLPIYFSMKRRDLSRSPFSGVPDFVPEDAPK